MLSSHFARLACLAAVTSAGQAQPGHRAPALNERLGHVVFPNSGAAKAQGDFLRGVLLLHSFEYERAAAAFRSAQLLDPEFVLAYWGEAMSYTHPIWDQQDSAAARRVLNRLGASPAARSAKARYGRERQYLATVERLYGPGSKALRDTLFEREMQQLAASYPDDVEARLFHALGLMGLSQGVRNVATYMRAGAIAEEVFNEHPTHPGAAHYVIHAFDDPVHAPLGLRAARAYSRIAPAAGHAQHMTTHIFLALGMWPEVVKQNEVALVANAGNADRANWFAGHYTAWLGYALLQEGRFDAARAHLMLMRSNQPRSTRTDGASSLLFMQATYVMETERWRDTTFFGPPAPDTVVSEDHALATFLQGVAALRSGHRQRAESALEAFDRGRFAVRAPPLAPNPRVVVMADQLRALLLNDAGRHEAAIELLRKTAATEDTLPVEFGPPTIVQPTHELIGEFLLAMGRPDEAQREFGRALERGPRRLRALAGLYRSAVEDGDTGAATDARRLLKETLTRADTGILAGILRAGQ